MYIRSHSVLVALCDGIILLNFFEWMSINYFISHTVFNVGLVQYSWYWQTVGTSVVNFDNYTCRNAEILIY